MQVAEDEYLDRELQLHAMRLQREHSVLKDRRLRRILAGGSILTLGLSVLILAGVTAWQVMSGVSHDRWLIGMTLTTLTLLLRLIFASLPAILTTLGRR